MLVCFTLLLWLLLLSLSADLAAVVPAHMEQLALLCAGVPFLLVCCVYVLHVGFKQRPERVFLLLAEVAAMAEADGGCHIILVV
jgi:hypothetical protein